MCLQYIKTPLGEIGIWADDIAVKKVLFCDQQSDTENTNSITQQTAKQLNEYFLGKRSQFELPLDPEGTSFQKQIWNELVKVHFGSTKTYLYLAEKINNPKSVRAVGAANGDNPIAIIIPCHRIIGSNGKLTGYAGGMERKRWLLEFEAKQSGKTLF